MHLALGRAGARTTLVSRNAPRFPCESAPCGCATAEKCWRLCCCNTPESRLSWCLAEGVVPPYYAVLPDGWSPARVALAIEAGAPTARDHSAREDHGCNPLPPCCAKRAAETKCADSDDGARMCVESGIANSTCGSSDRSAPDRTDEVPSQPTKAKPLVGGTSGKCSGQSNALPLVVAPLPPLARIAALTLAPLTHEGIVILDTHAASRTLTVDPAPPRRAASKSH
jgi:hypothetical protein